MFSDRESKAVLCLVVAIATVWLVLLAPGVGAKTATVSSSGPNSTAPGDTVIISITLTNTDSSKDNYIAAVSVPDGWSVDSRTDAGGTWNSGEISWLWQNIDAGNSVNPSVTLVVPNNETSGTYTIKTTGKSKDGTEDTTSHAITVDNPNDDDRNSDDGSTGDDESGDDGGTSGGNGGGGSVGGGSNSGSIDDQTEESGSDETKETGDQVAEQIRNTPPSSETVVDIKDIDSETKGVTIDTEQTQSVDKITFNDESVTGTVETKEYQTLPQAVTDQIATTVLEIEAANNADSETGSSETQAESSSGQTDTTVNVVSVTDISPSYESTAGTGATVTLSVDRTDIKNPANAFITHETTTGWEKLETTVAETTDGKVILEAKTDSFSLFAVVETENPTQSESSDQETQSTVESDESTLPTMPVVGVLIGIVLVGTILWAQRRLN